MPVVGVASVVCDQCGEWTVASGAEVDGLDDVEVFSALWRQSAYIGRPGHGCGTRPGLVGDGRGSPSGGGGAVVSGTCSRHPGHCRIAVRARLRRWDEWLLGAPRHWHESAGEGYPPPGDIGRHQSLGCPLDQAPAAASPKSQPKVDGGRVLRVRTLARQWSRFMVAMGPQLSGRLPTGGRAAPWHAAVMFVVWNPDRGVCLPVPQRPRWCGPGGARWRCRQVLLAEDIKPLSVAAVPSVTRPYILDTQAAQCVEREVPVWVSRGGGAV